LYNMGFFLGLGKVWIETVSAQLFFGMKT